MPRRRRIDGRGYWQHVVSRGIARRTVFETEADTRQFLAGLARVVRAGELEVHAYCLMTTHLHLFLRSPQGRLPDGMQRVLNGYVRWFNRVRKRDGPLFRSRFTSRHVASDQYRRALVRYIDHNPVTARLVEDPSEFPYGSAWHFTRGDVPPWLERDWIEDSVCWKTGRELTASTYRETFGSPLEPREIELLERRLRRHDPTASELDDLVGMAPGRVLDWMRRKAALADGTPIGTTLCLESDVHRCLAFDRRHAENGPATSGLSKDPLALAEAGLLRDLCGSSFVAIGKRLGVSHVHASRLHAEHRRRLAADDAYAKRVARITADCLRGDVHTGPGSC